MADPNERSRQIVLGHQEGEIFGEAIREHYGGQSLEDIAGDDTAEAIQALETGLHAVIAHYGVVRVGRMTVDGGKLRDRGETPKVERRADGDRAFEGAVREHLGQCTAWIGQNLMEGREVVVRVLKASEEQRAFPTSEDQTVTLATLSRPEGPAAGS